MSIAAIRSLALDVTFATIGVAATVTRPAPDDAPIETTVVWNTALHEDVGGLGLARREPRRVLAVRRSAVSTVPRGTVIVAPLMSGGDAQVWRVDGTDRLLDDVAHVVVVPQPDTRTDAEIAADEDDG